MAPKAKFTRAQLQEAALALVDEQGLAACPCARWQARSAPGR